MKLTYQMIYGNKVEDRLLHLGALTVNGMRCEWTVTNIACWQIGDR